MAGKCRGKHNQDRAGESLAQLGVAVLWADGKQSPLSWEGCPCEPSSSEAESTELQTAVSPKNLPELLNWLCSALDGCPSLHLAFAPELTKQQRAMVHRHVDDDPTLKAALLTISQGTGDARTISVFSRGHAPAATEVPLEMRLLASRVYKAAASGWTGPRHSLDELCELIMLGQLPEGLTALAAKVNEQQPVVDRLLAAIYADNAQAIHVVALTHAQVIKSGCGDIDTGEVPLGVAARVGSLGALRALLQYGAPLEGRDRRGSTALKLSRTFENTDAEALLLQAGAVDPEAHLFPLSVAAAQLISAHQAATTAAQPLCDVWGDFSEAPNQAEALPEQAPSPF